MLFDSYKVKSDHRNDAMKKHKSQWSISHWQELNLFSTAHAKGWCIQDENIVWAVLVDDASLSVVGTDSSLSSYDLYIARYVCDQGQWHGYPIAPKQYDRPPASILEKWRAAGHISNSTMNKWLQGKI